MNLMTRWIVTAGSLDIWWLRADRPGETILTKLL